MSRPLPTEQRLLEATLVCLARHGIAKTTLDDVAREAAIHRLPASRATSGRVNMKATAMSMTVVRPSVKAKPRTLPTDR